MIRFPRTLRPMLEARGLPKWMLISGIVDRRCSS